MNSKMINRFLPEVKRRHKGHAVIFHILYISGLQKCFLRLLYSVSENDSNYPLHLRNLHGRHDCNIKGMEFRFFFQVTLQGLKLPLHLRNLRGRHACDINGKEFSSPERTSNETGKFSTYRH